MRYCELDPVIEEEVDRIVKEKVGEEGYLGYCHAFWSLKKKILAEDYGIDWKTPAEMNPHIIFD